MRGKCNIKDIWPIGRPEENLCHHLPLTTMAILKVYAYHKFIENQTIYQSCKSVALKIINYASFNRIPRAGLTRLIFKVRSLRDRWKQMRDHYSRKSETENNKRNNYIDLEFLQEFDLGQKRDSNKTSKPKTPSKPHSLPKILFSKRTRCFKLVS